MHRHAGRRRIQHGCPGGRIDEPNIIELIIAGHPQRREHQRLAHASGDLLRRHSGSAQQSFDVPSRHGTGGRNHRAVARDELDLHGTLDVARHGHLAGRHRQTRAEHAQFKRGQHRRGRRRRNEQPEQEKERTQEQVATHPKRGGDVLIALWCGMAQATETSPPRLIWRQCQRAPVRFRIHGNHGWVLLNG